MNRGATINKTRRLVKTEKTNFVDASTGEVLGSSIRNVTNAEEGVYVKLYLTNFAFMFDMTRSEALTLQWIAGNMDYLTGVVTIGLDERELIAEAVGVKERQVCNILKSLKDKQILSSRLNKKADKVLRGSFLVNPHLISRCPTKEVLKQREYFDFTVNRLAKLSMVKEVNKQISEACDEK